MAIVPMQKVNIVLHKKDRNKVLHFLQEKSVFHVSDVKTDREDVRIVPEDTNALQFKVAELDFSIRFLARFESKKKGLQAMLDGDAVHASAAEVAEVVKGFDYSKVVESCQALEEQLVTFHNESKNVKQLIEKLSPWVHYEAPLNAPMETDTSQALFVSVPLKDWDAFRDEVNQLSKLLVIELDNIVGIRVFCKIVFEKGLYGQIEQLALKHKGEIVDLPNLPGTPSQEIDKAEQKLKAIKTQTQSLEEEAGKLAKNLDKLRMLYDHYQWELHQKEVSKMALQTEASVVVAGWMPKAGVPQIRTELESVTPHFELLEVFPDDEEEPPVLIANPNFVKPFKAVTDVYGLPLYREVDPTPYLAVFFIVFFGMCLTDAGYGIIMFATMWAALRFLDIPAGMRNLVRLLMYGGILTFIMGVLFGGWFGLTPEQAPAFMTVMRDGELMFRGQTFDALGNAMQVLILSLALGYIQTWFGVLISFLHNYRTRSKKDAMLDNFPWVFTLTAIALYILVVAGILPQSLEMPFRILLYVSGAMIVLTQGRHSKSIIGKFFVGVIRLYDLVSYMSAVLSYSRLLALGLATAIIGMAVNTIAELTYGIPYVGIVLMIIVLVVGHIFNLGINALGSFIHSGRLQFVEFFGNFLEGGGTGFKPLSRESRFVRLKK
jgi:V/A-type H+-transporting ATPase subunit I